MSEAEKIKLAKVAMSAAGTVMCPDETMASMAGSKTSSITQKLENT